MSFFNTAVAATPVTQGTAHASEMNFMSFLPMIVIFILFWFLLIRPQQKKAKLHSKMMSELQAGEEVLTTGGIVGKIVKTEDVYIQLEIASGVIITIQKTAVASKINRDVVTIDKENKEVVKK